MISENIESNESDVIVSDATVGATEEDSSEGGFAIEQEIADRNRLIRKGKGVLDLCIEQNKLLCVQGFVDSQIERGGVYLEVVREMETYITAELNREPGKQQKNNLKELKTYIVEKLQEVG